MQPMVQEFEVRLAALDIALKLQDEDLSRLLSDAAAIRDFLSGRGNDSN